MEVIILNKDNLCDEEVTDFSLKVRGIIKKDDSFVVGKYADVYLLPGGKIEVGENALFGLSRELKEEIGIDYSVDEFVPFIRVIHYEKDYIIDCALEVIKKEYENLDYETIVIDNIE